VAMLLRNSYYREKTEVRNEISNVCNLILGVRTPPFSIYFIFEAHKYFLLEIQSNLSTK